MLELLYDNLKQRGDVSLAASGSLDTDEGLGTVVEVSLLTDARASVDDGEIDASQDPRGWWGEQFLDEDENTTLGSKFWLLTRGKLTNDTLLKAKQYGEDALQWLITLGVADTVTVTAERQQNSLNVAIITVQIQRPHTAAPRFERAWKVTFGI